MTVDYEEAKVIIVTGANKGIGRAIVKNSILQSSDDTKERPSKIVIYLTSRNKELGERAVSEIKKELLGALNEVELLHHSLDINSKQSIYNLVAHIENIHGGLDVLVNNAAISYHPPNMYEEPINSTIHTNYYATLNMMEAFLPLMKRHGRIINISSRLGRLWPLKKNLRNRFLRCESLAQVSELMEEFKESVNNGNHVEKGWPESVAEDVNVNDIPYAISKMGVTAAKKVFSDRVSQDKNLLVRCCHPGYVSTDMTNHLGELSVDEGARTLLFLMFSPAEAIFNASTNEQYDSGLGIFWNLCKPSQW